MLQAKKYKMHETMEMHAKAMQILYPVVYLGASALRNE